jgi:ring-1,2-phenylacetyl-CoA epoxidase subunit PaaB
MSTSKEPSPLTGEGRVGVNSEHATSQAQGAHSATTSPPSPTLPPSRGKGADTESSWPLWEVFVRSKAGLDHKHCGSLHAPDAKAAIQLARDVYTRRQEGNSIWVVQSTHIVASDPGDKDMYFDPMVDKVYRHPTFYTLPQAVDHL